MLPSDHELLREYAERGSQAAFTELANRHLDLVYSAARRQVNSSALAEEIGQSVFLDLSRSAHRISPRQPLVAWLFFVTRRTAIDVIRRESRRQSREQTGLQIDSMNPAASVWTEVAPLLDAALEKLNETDRAAVLLRFFQNKSSREVGQLLDTSEEAAHKRIARAIDRLRGILSRSGVSVGAAGLVNSLSAHAVETAPAKFAGSIAPAMVAGAPHFSQGLISSAGIKAAVAGMPRKGHVRNRDVSRVLERASMRTSLSRFAT